MRGNYIKSLFFIFFFLCLSYLYARDVTVTVMDSDIDLPLEGAVIRTRDGIEYICGENGSAVIQVPDDRQTIIQAAYPGYETGSTAIPVTGNTFTISLRLSGLIQGRELILEASRPFVSETRTGRSVAVTSTELSQTAEIGIIEDVMRTISLLPGVLYSGFLNAQPSIRGGHPGEMSASLDGFYINNPFFWGGGFSIFDPNVVNSAQLSHGVFSSRYGHTISGLLEVTTKDPSHTQMMFELGINTSTANFNLSIPLFGRGGIIFTGRLTYYDPIIAAFKELAWLAPELEMLDYIKTAPYIRAGTATGNYRFQDNLLLTATGFFGMDGMGAYFLNTSNTEQLHSETSADFDFINYQGFLITSLSWNPRHNMLLRLTAGTGYEDRIINGEMSYNIIEKYFSNSFKATYTDLAGINDSYNYKQDSLINQNEFNFNAQGRIDYDWELSHNFLLSAGIQEMYNHFSVSGNQMVRNEIIYRKLDLVEKSIILPIIIDILGHEPPKNSIFLYDLRIEIPVRYSPETQNNLFTTSGYILFDFNAFDSRFKAELGLRIDHFFLSGSGFNLSSDPVFNPRLNIDYNLLNDFGIFHSFDITAGTGLFSSINETVFMAEERYGINSMKPNRSWTSVVGTRIEFPESITLNIEGYFKYVFDRMYIPLTLGINDIDISPHFDGEGIVWGIDVMLQRFQSRFWDGWLSYSFNWAKYRDPNGNQGGRGMSGGNYGSSWYFPSFHRFHNLNIVFNYKPVQNINIYFRFGFASGVPMSRRLTASPQSYPVLIYNNDESYFIEKYIWPSVIDDSNRTTPSLPFDIKFSIFGSSGRIRYEVYVAVENILALLYNAQSNTSFNQYTGQVDSGSSNASYDMPIPIPSFGFRMSY